VAHDSGHLASDIEMGVKCVLKAQLRDVIDGDAAWGKSRRITGQEFAPELRVGGATGARRGKRLWLLGDGVHGNFLLFRIDMPLALSDGRAQLFKPRCCRSVGCRPVARPPESERSLR